MTRKEQEDHSGLVQRLAARVRGKYSILQTEVPVTDPGTGRTVGEMDLVGLVEGMVDLYEVKVNDDASKARKQLRNMREYLSSQGYTCPINLYYYSGRTGKITKVD
ncbi:hypothetical protein KY363_02175 [Candidatus Woesearchaeota archaeon]|nr:hypothetical protein [Candidatus Woesearchaeota archaeon]